MSGSPEILIAGPKITPPRISILSVAELVSHTDERHGGGIGFRPDGPPEGSLFDICTPGITSAGSVTNKQTWEGFGVRTADSSSQFGFKVAERQERATRKLLGIEAFLIEQQFFGNPLSLGDDVVALASASATVVSGGSAISPIKALALAENTIGTETKGGHRGIIHARPSILTLWAENGAVRREGNIWLTATDNIVLPGRGYSGVGPTGQAVSASSEWIYLTTGIQIHRGPVVVSPDTEAEAMNRQTNTSTYYASRIVGIAWDPNTLHAAIQVNPS
jgi:hypothetical protein